MNLAHTPFELDERTYDAHLDMTIAMRNGRLRALPTDFAPLEGATGSDDDTPPAH